MIFIYDDGIHNNISVMRALAAIDATIPCRFIGASDISDGALDHCDLIVMPGGADLYYCEKLDGVGNQHIRGFVHKGGSYLGICAGAYYGCASLNWNDGEIAGQRELGFYNGIATGPAHDFIETPADIYNGSWIKAVEIESNGTKFLSEYSGGPIFQEPDDNKTKVLARYTALKNTPPAVISGTFGKGNYVLASPHIERFGHLLTDGLYKHLNKSYNWETKEIDRLLGHEQAQKDFFTQIIAQLL